MSTPRSAETARTRERILEAAAVLVATQGPEAVSMRAVSTAARIQAPTIYRHFGNKQGLLDAVAAHGFAAHVRSQPDLQPHGDPVDDLRWGWDSHVAYALAHPHLYRMTHLEPHDGPPHPAAVVALEILAGRIHRIAEEGRLTVAEERAVQLVRAGAAGTVVTLLATPEQERDAGLSTSAREAVVAAITTEPPRVTGHGPATPARQLRAMLDRVTVLSAAERALLQEWLSRVAAEKADSAADAATAAGAPS